MRNLLFRSVQALWLTSLVSAVPALADPADPAPPSPTFATPASIVTRQIVGFQTDSARVKSRIADAAARNDALRDEQRADLSAMTGWVQQINARLAAGTTRGNPDLVVQWQQAQLSLNALERSFLNLPQNSAEIAQCVGLAGYLANAIKAADALPGATDEEHATLIALEQSAMQSAQDANAVARRVNNDIDRQSAALDAAHRQLTSLRHAIDMGVPLDGSIAAAIRTPE